MRSTDDAVLHAVLQCKAREVDAALELMRLNYGQGEQRWRRTAAKILKILQVRMHIFVNNGGFDFTSPQPRGCHAAEVRNRSVGHEALSKSFHISVRAILAWF